MQAIRPLPKEVQKALGEEGADQFVLFLNKIFEEHKQDTIQAVSDSFHNHVTEEVSKVRLEVADLRSDMVGLRSELKSDMADLRAELKSDISHLDNRISGLRAEFKSDMAGLYRAISIQTRWILMALLGGAIIYPIAIKLIDKLLP